LGVKISSEKTPRSEQLNDAHIEPGELVLRVLSENKGEED